MLKKHHLLSLFLALLTIVALVTVGLYLYFNWQTYGPILTSRERFHEYIQSFGVWAPFVFLSIQILQVIITPIPGGVTTMMGGVMFGALWGSLLSCAGVLIGSLIAFFLARRLGQGFVIRWVGRANFEKYNKVFSGRLSLTLLILFLIPFFPDDLLCFLAGLSALSLRTFVILLVVGRIPGAVGMVLIGSGLLVFSLGVWIIVGICALVALLFFVGYRHRLEKWIYEKVLDSKRPLQD